MKSKKLQLNSIKVKSFATQMDEQSAKTAKGGALYLEPSVYNICIEPSAICDPIVTPSIYGCPLPTIDTIQSWDYQIGF